MNVNTQGLNETGKWQQRSRMRIYLYLIVGCGLSRVGGASRVRVDLLPVHKANYILFVLCHHSAQSAGGGGSHTFTKTNYLFTANLSHRHRYVRRTRHL